MSTLPPLGALATLLLTSSATLGQSAWVNYNTDLSVDQHLLPEIRKITYHQDSLTIWKTNGTTTAYAMADIRRHGFLDVTGIGTRPDIAPQVTVFPNPATEEVSLSYVLKAVGHVRFSLMDQTGRLLAQTEEMARTAGAHTRSWPVGHLSPGLYLMVLDTASGRATVTFTKQ